MPDAPVPIIYPPDDPNTVIWRYIDFTKLVSMLQTRSLHLSRSDELGDPFEGSVPLELAARGAAPDGTWLAKVFGPGPAAERYEGIRRYVFVNCWAMSEMESAALWQLYVPSNQGVAVRSTYARLVSALMGAEKHVDVGVVRYIDFAKEGFFPPDGPESENLITPFFHKRKSFEHEHELRAFWWDGESSNANMGGHVRGDPMPAKFMEGVWPGGVDVPIDLAAVVEEVRVSPSAPPWFSDLVDEVVRRYEFGFPVRQSDLAVDPVY